MSDCNIESMLGGVPSGQTESLTVRRGSPERGSLRSVTVGKRGMFMLHAYVCGIDLWSIGDPALRWCERERESRDKSILFLTSIRVAATPCGKGTSHRVTPDGELSN